MQTDSTTPQTFVSKYLPWTVGAGAFVFYLFTLHFWITLPSMVALPQVAGWDWQPVYYAPLRYLVTLPVHWLPGSWQVAGANLVAAVCTSLALVFLTRAVALLPHDRTRDQRALERSDYSFLSGRYAFLPPLFAALICGLQYSVWQHSVVDTGEALDLLLFTYLVRCLLEARVSPRDGWLIRGAFVYGLSMTNNFAMIGFLPAFLLALIWVKGLRVFDSGLVIQMVLWGLAGLSFYFLLPTINSLSGVSEHSFWEMVRMNLGAQKEALINFPRYVLVFISLTSLLPVLFIGFRWPAQFGDISAAGNALTNLMTHVIHAVFLVACVYVAFDPAFSPRRLGAPYPLLPFYVLGALSAGYCAGYFLLVFSGRPGKSWEQPSVFRIALNRFVVGVVYVAALAVPIALFIQNRPEILEQRNPALADYGQALARSLPKTQAVVLSDDAYRLYALQAALTSRSDRDRYIFIHTGSLTQPAYHRYLVSRYPDRWPKFMADRPVNQAIEPLSIIETTLKLSERLPLYYLHPSFGYFFEYFYARPHELVYPLTRYGTNQVAPPPLTVDEIGHNEAFWKQFFLAQPDILRRSTGKQAKGLADVLSSNVGMMYSAQINYAGVAMQRSGALEQAAAYFKDALTINSNNPAAYINSQFNAIFRAGRTNNFDPDKDVTQRLVPYGHPVNWNRLLQENGPIDEPSSCFIFANVLLRGRNFRQACQELMRVVNFQPQNLQAHVMLAVVLSRANMPAKALEYLGTIRQQFDPQRVSIQEQIGISQAEAWAWARLGDWDKVGTLLRPFQSPGPQAGRAYAAEAEIYMDSGRLTNALAVFERQLAVDPKNSGALINFSALKIQNKEYPAAIQVLDGILRDEPKNVPALQNRAIANLLSGRLDQADADYRLLQQDPSHPVHSVHYGLGEIAFQKGDRKAARTHYENFLATAPSGAPETPYVQQRMKELTGGKRR